MSSVDPPGRYESQVELPKVERPVLRILRSQLQPFKNDHTENMQWALLVSILDWMAELWMEPSCWNIVIGAHTSLDILG